MSPLPLPGRQDGKLGRSRERCYGEEKGRWGLRERNWIVDRSMVEAWEYREAFIGKGRQIKVRDVGARRKINMGVFGRE